MQSVQRILQDGSMIDQDNPIIESVDFLKFALKTVMFKEKAYNPLVYISSVLCVIAYPAILVGFCLGWLIVKCFNKL